MHYLDLGIGLLFLLLWRKENSFDIWNVFYIWRRGEIAFGLWHKSTQLVKSCAPIWHHPVQFSEMCVGALCKDRMKYVSEFNCLCK